MVGGGGSFAGAGPDAGQGHHASPPPPPPAQVEGAAQAIHEYRQREARLAEPRQGVEAARATFQQVPPPLPTILASVCFAWVTTAHAHI